MADGKALQELADRFGWNPYYLAYAIATGAANPRAAFERDKGNHLFVAWNTERWDEQRIREGFFADKTLSPADARGFCSAATGASDRHCDLLAEHLGEKLDRYIASATAPAETPQSPNDVDTQQRSA